MLKSLIGAAGGVEKAPCKHVAFALGQVFSKTGQLSEPLQVLR